MLGPSVTPVDDFLPGATGSPYVTDGRAVSQNRLPQVGFVCCAAHTRDGFMRMFLTCVPTISLWLF